MAFTETSAAVGVLPGDCRAAIGRTDDRASARAGRYAGRCAGRLAGNFAKGESGHGALSFRFTYREAVSWGARLPNGSWTGSIRMLVEDEADLAATELMMTSDRLDAVKFTTPVYTTK